MDPWENFFIIDLIQFNFLKKSVFCIQFIISANTFSAYICFE